MKIIVLAGGLSPERDVSLSSGALIAGALIENGHEVMLLDLYLGVRNREIPPVYRNRESGEQFHYAVCEQEPDLVQLQKEAANGKSLVGEGVLALCQDADVVFLALHGSIGENGQLQALFDAFGIRYTGTGYAGSLLAMDKDLSKQLMRKDGIDTANWMRLSLTDGKSTPEIHFPCVVKPCGCGSSVGVSILYNATQWDQAIACAKKYEDEVIVEDFITGREFSVGILNGVPLPVIEILPKSGFYDYKNKYQAGLTEEICPACISEPERMLLQQNALRVHQTLRLGFYSRVDFILDPSGAAVCLEANTLPGMTPTSLLPQEARAVGISYSALCEQIVRAAAGN